MEISNMPIVTFNSRFHGIGQGLFYSLQVNNFNMVYDCGSETKGEQIKRAIESEDFSAKQIKLFVISHSHNDHINGIKVLQKNGVTVEEFVMSYFSAEVRYFFYDENDGENNLDFIIDPVAYLRELFPNCRISFILPGTSGTSDEEPQEESASDNEAGYRWMGSAETDKPEWPEDQNVSFYKENIKYKAPFWEFKFLQDSFPSRIDEKILKQDILDAKLDITDALQINEILSVINKRIPSQTRNETSLICCHGPVIRSRPDIRGRWCVEYHVQSEINTLHHFHHSFYDDVSSINLTRQPPLYHMMTGDALLEDKSRYQSHFYNRLFDISVFQIPHHGSRENWQSWLPACHPYTETWIYSYGTGNRHGHPTANFGAIRSPLKLIGLIENQLHSISGEIYYDQ